jgi:glycosyltransferase involved in cell wall biosynthesis
VIFRSEQHGAAITGPSASAYADLAGARLLFVVNVAWFFLSHRLAIARSARQVGVDVHLAADVEDESEFRRVEQEGIRFHRIRLVRGGVQPLRELVTLGEIARVVRRVRPDIVHNVTPKPVIYGSIAARLAGTAGIVNAISGFGYAYGTGGGRRRPLARLADLAYATAFRGPTVRIVVQNGDDFAEVRRIRPEASRRTILVPGSGVDLDEFAAGPEPDGVPVVVLSARMLRDKGVVEFAEAAALLRASRVAARFVLAGRLDPSNPTALSATELAALSERCGVEWIGETRDVPALLRSCHVVCLPTYYREGVPKALLEACAARRPIVTTDVAGCRDVVHDGVNGLLVPPRSPESLAVALRRLIEDADLRRRMGGAGLERARREFDVHAVVRRHLDVYRELIAGRRAGAGAGR